MREQLSIITAAVERAPDWVRQDLTSKEDSVRRRAEETLAAMISAALAQDVVADAA